MSSEFIPLHCCLVFRRRVVMSCCVWLSAFYLWGKWSTESESKLPRGTQQAVLERGQHPGLQNPCLLPGQCCLSCYDGGSPGLSGAQEKGRSIQPGSQGGFQGASVSAVVPRPVCPQGLAGVIADHSTGLCRTTVSGQGVIGRSEDRGTLKGSSPRGRQVLVWCRSKCCCHLAMLAGVVVGHQAGRTSRTTHPIS